jgi:geranylgeranyl transferase type-2 subunit beta
MQLDKSKDLDSIGYYLTEHLRVAGGYWTLNALACLGMLDRVPAEKRAELSTQIRFYR